MCMYIFMWIYLQVWRFLTASPYLWIETKENGPIYNFCLSRLILHASYSQFTLSDWKYWKAHDKQFFISTKTYVLLLTWCFSSYF